MPLFGFIAHGHRDAYLDFLRRCRRASDNSPDIAAEIAILKGTDGRHVQLICRVRTGRNGSRECFTTLVDVTDRKQLEVERDRGARELAALASRLISAQDDERLRIARNLHDDLGQQFTALRLRLDELESGVTDETTGAALARVQDMLQQLDKRLHFVASDLRPAALDLGIVTALDQFVREWSATFGVPAAFHSAGIQADMDSASCRDTSLSHCARGVEQRRQVRGRQPDHRAPRAP